MWSKLEITVKIVMKKLSWSGVIHEWICLEFWFHLMATSFQGLLNAFKKKWLLVVGCMTIFERGISYWLWTLRVNIITQGCQRFSNCKKNDQDLLVGYFFWMRYCEKMLVPRNWLSVNILLESLFVCCWFFT